MAALALAVGAFLVQTRLPNAKCSAIESTMGVARIPRIPSRFHDAACAPPASERCAEVVKHQGASCYVGSAAILTHALELDSGERTR